MSFYMWLYVIKKLAPKYSKAIAMYDGKPDEEKFELYQEFLHSGWNHQE